MEWCTLSIILTEFEIRLRRSWITKISNIWILVLFSLEALQFRKKRNRQMYRLKNSLPRDLPIHPTFYSLPEEALFFFFQKIPLLPNKHCKKVLEYPVKDQSILKMNRETTTHPRSSSVSIRKPNKSRWLQPPHYHINNGGNIISSPPYGGSGIRRRCYTTTAAGSWPHAG